MTTKKISASSVSLEHLDPITHTLICGLRNNNNEIMASLDYNARKTNRFVPYRACDYPAPVTFGDIGEFLIGGKWMVCEFGGEIWWNESNKIGCSSTAPKCPEKCSKAGKIGGPRGGRKNVESGWWDEFRMKGTLARRKGVVVVHPESCGIWEFDSTQHAADSLPISRAGLRQTADGHKEIVKGFIACYV